MFEPAINRGLISKHLQPGNNNIVRETLLDNWDGEISFETKGDNLASTLEVSDNFSIDAEFGNVEGVDFYVLCCNKTLHIVEENFECKRGAKFVAGEQVVARKYYKKWGNLMGFMSC
jgi:hypothetical protein